MDKDNVLVITCPCCGKKIEISEEEFERRVQQVGRMVPMFCTNDCAIRFSS